MSTGLIITGTDEPANISMVIVPRLTPHKPYYYYRSIPMLLGCVIGVVSVLLNGTTLLAIFKIRDRWTNNIRFVISLTTSDIITSITVICDSTLELSTKNFSGRGAFHSCASWFLHDLRYISLMATMMVLTLIAIDLYLAIASPLRYTEFMNHRIVGWCVATAWGISLLMGSAALYAPAVPYSFCILAPRSGDNFCERKFDCNKFRVDFLVCFVLCVTALIMLVVYTHTFLKLHRFQWEPTPAGSGQHHHHQNHRMRRNRRGLVTTVIILATFLACFLPYFIYTYSNFLHITTLDVSQRDWFESTNTKGNQLYLEDSYLRDLLLINALFDPLLYAFRLHDVRWGYQRLCRLPRRALFLRRGSDDGRYASGIQMAKSTTSNRTVLRNMSRENQAIPVAEPTKCRSRCRLSESNNVECYTVVPQAETNVDEAPSKVNESERPGNGVMKE